MRAPALAAAVALLAACRPDVEAGVPCAAGGDLSCPTGFHCGPRGTCEPGEVPPSIRVLAPAPGLARGRVEVVVEAASPRGLGAATLRLQREGDADGRPLEAERTDAPGRTRLTLTARLDTWTLQNGVYDLLVEASAATAPVGPSQARVRVEVANRPPVPVVTAPLADALVRDALAVKGAATHDAPLTAATLELRRGDQLLADAGATVSGDGFEGTLELTSVPDGPALLRVDVRDATGRTGSAERPVVVRNARLAAVSASSTPVGRSGGVATLVLNEAPAAPPLLVAPGLRVEAPEEGDEGRAWSWRLGAAGATGTVSATIAATSVAGDALEVPLAIVVDLEPPRLVDGLRLELMSSGVRVRFACSEPSDWSIGTPPSTGNCDPAAASRPAPTARRGDRLRVVDAAGNDAEFLVTERVEEDPPAFAAGSLRLPAGRPDPYGLAMLAPVSAPVADIAANDGASLVATSADAPAPAAGRAGPLRRTATRPVALSSAASGALLLGLPEGTDERGRLAIHEWTQAGGAALRGYVRLDLRVRPALHPATGQLVFAREGRLRVGALSGPALDLGSIAGLAARATDAVACGASYVALGLDAANAPSTLLAGLDGAAPPVAFAAPAEARSPSSRLLCGQGRVLLVAPGSASMAAWELDANARAWSPRSTGAMPVRTGFSAGEATIAGGERADGTLLRDAWRWDGSAFQPLASGPGRKGGLLVAGPGGATLVVGGTGTGAWGLVASSLDGWAEHGTPAPALPALGAVAWSSDRASLTLLADEGATTSRLWEWSAGPGWTAGPTMPYRRGATLLARSGSVLVTGGVTAGGVALGTSFAWDGRTLSPAPGVDGEGLVATTLADGRVAFAGGTDPATRGTVDVRVATLASGTRSSLTTGDVQLLPVPGRDVITWLSAGRLYESRVGAGGVTPIGSVALDPSLTPVVLPGAGLFLASTGSAVAWQPLPSAPGVISPPVNAGGSPARGPCFSSEPALREAACVPDTDEDPPVLSFVDRAHAAIAFSPAGAGAGRVELCARANVGGVRSGAVTVHVVSGNTVATPQGAMDGNCRRFELDFAASEEAVVVVAADPPHADGAPVKLELDAFRATRLVPGP